MDSEEHREIRKVAYSDEYSTIERYRKGDVTILTMSGRFTTKLKSNALTMVKALKGDVALEVKGVSPIDLSFASFLRTLQQHVHSHKDSFILLRPPSRIVDMLNMCYGPGEFDIMTDETQVAGRSRKTGAAPQQAVPRPQQDGLAADVRRRVSSLRREVIKTEEREKSLEIARSRLIKMLPQVAPKIPRVEIGSVYRPADKIGGDVYDFVNLEHGRHGIFLGDVSGHGIEAAVVVGMAKKVFDIYSKILITPKRVLSQSNKEIYPDLDANTFITAIYGVLEEATMDFTYGRAGHPHPVLFNERRSDKPQVLASKGMSIGLDAGKLFNRMIEESTIRLVPGDVFIIYTDGVTEAASPQGEEYGVPRLLEAVRTNAQLPAAALVANIYKDATEFSQIKEQQDDITIICIKAL